MNTTFASDEHLDVFHVRMRNGSVHTMSVDELDDAFQRGRVDERTPVLRSGALTWSTLGAIAGLDEPEPSSIAPVELARALEPEGSLEVPAGLRPRRGGKLLAALVALVVIGGIGFAATRARSSIAYSFAAMGTKQAQPKVEAPLPPAAATSKVVTAPAAPVAPSPVATSPVSTVSPTSASNASIPTLSPDQLPTAAPADKKPVRRVKGKR